MTPLLIVVAAVLLFVLPIKWAVMLPLVLLLALLTTFVRRCPELNQRGGRCVLMTKSPQHVRYRLGRWPFFLILPRRMFGA